MTHPVPVNPAPISRRDFLRYLGIGSGALLVGLPSFRGLAKAPAGFDPDLWLELTAAPNQVALRAGTKTCVWSYRARVLKGDAQSVQTLTGSYLGPTLHVRRGQKVRVDFRNGTDEPSIINWHGLHVPAQMMGLPRYAVQPGGRYRYEFTLDDRAGTYWYHAMSAGHTPEQVYFGLAGLLLVSDAEERQLSLPRGEYDLPIVIQDRDFGADNQFRYLPGTGPAAARGDAARSTPMRRHGGNMGAMMGGGGGGMMGGNMGAMTGGGGGAMTGGGGGGMMGGGMGAMMGGGMDGMMGGGMDGMMTRVMGFFGDAILINGHSSTTLEVATHAYRLRVLNASNARIYKLAWQDHRPLTVIATGGGLLDAPVRKDYVMLAPGQRIELWADFSQDRIGSERALLSLAFTGTMGMMGGGMMASMPRTTQLAPGTQFRLVNLRITRRSDERLKPPPRLSKRVRLRAADAVNQAHPRTFNITMQRMRWGFNGLSYRMDEVAPDEIVKLGTTEVWEFANNRMMAHAIHVHGLQFQVLERLDSPKGGGVVEGCVDHGWEDTVLVLPGERVRVIMRFQDFTGSYAYQCHMLEHAADGLMREYRVRG